MGGKGDWELNSKQSVCWLFISALEPKWNHYQIKFYFSVLLVFFLSLLSHSLTPAVSGSQQRSPILFLMIINNKKCRPLVLISILGAPSASLFCLWSGTQVVVATESLFHQSLTVSPANSILKLPEPTEPETIIQEPNLVPGSSSWNTGLVPEKVLGPLGKLLQWKGPKRSNACNYLHTVLYSYCADNTNVIYLAKQVNELLLCGGVSFYIWCSDLHFEVNMKSMFLGCTFSSTAALPL